MAIPISYSIRNLLTRRLTTALTAAGMALVVFVFAALSMFAEGLEKTLAETGSPDNVILIRKGSLSDTQSGISRAEAHIVGGLAQIAAGDDGRPLIAKELIVLITLPKKGQGKPSNVLIRGGTENSLKLRPQVKLIQGRMPRRGTSEIIVGRGIAEKFSGVAPGSSLRFALSDWTVTGTFDAGQTAFSSEIWGDVDVMMQAFRRPVYSSILFRLKGNALSGEAEKAVDSDPRLTLTAKRETKYYAEQSVMMVKFLRIMGTSLTLVFSIGAVIGAMITMYSAVANRVGEIGTLRALGFGRLAILAAFVAESVFIGVAGGLIGLFLASFLRYFTISTLNIQSFSEIAFPFTLTFGISIKALLASLVMGLAGGLFPAIRASRMNIVQALRTD